MWRSAASALLAAAPIMPHRFHGISPPLARLKREPPVLAVSPNTQATVVARPPAIASAAICTSAPAVPPPIVIEPV